MAWLVFALLSAALWGLCYVAHEQMLKNISAPMTMLLTSLGTIPIYFAMTLLEKDANAEWRLSFSGGHVTYMLALAVGTAAMANLFMCFSIKAKNATLAGLIEISYPLFIALFTWLIFKEQQLTPGTGFGAFLIFSGIACIYYFSRSPV